MQNTKTKQKTPTFFREAIPSIPADKNAGPVETFAPQEDHLLIMHATISIIKKCAI